MKQQKGSGAPAAIDSPTIAVQPAQVEITGDTAVAEQDEIARLAYSFWEARGFQGGSPEDDWLRAEREVLARWPAPHAASAQSA